MGNESLRSGQDVEAILRLAIQSGTETGGDLRDQLQRSADELGISREALTKAEDRFVATLKIERFMKAKRQGFQSKLTKYLSINLMFQFLWGFLSKTTPFGFFYRTYELPVLFLFVSSVYIATKFVQSRQVPTHSDPSLKIWQVLGEPDTYPINHGSVASQRL